MSVYIYIYIYFLIVKKKKNLKRWFYETFHTIYVVLCERFLIYYERVISHSGLMKYHLIGRNQYYTTGVLNNSIIYPISL